MRACYSGRDRKRVFGRSARLRNEARPRRSRWDLAEEATRFASPGRDAGGSAFSLLSGANWLVAVFLLMLVLPSDILWTRIGPLRITGYRVFLLLAFIPLLTKLFLGHYGRVLLCDWLMLCCVSWICLAIGVHHGFARAAESGGIYVVEVFGGYLVGRALVRNAREFRGTAVLLVLVVIVSCLFTVPESLTGKNFFGLPGLRGGARFGLHRARGTFEHPILYGIFCASVLCIAWYVLPNSDRLTFRRVSHSGWVFLSAASSVSSGALATMLSQMVLAGWDRATRTVRHRWLWFVALGVLAWHIIDWLSNRTPMKVLLYYLTFNARTAYWRLIIWEWGMQHNVAAHPLFGIGFNEWVRPSWMHSVSMDSFWLFMMVCFGLPAFLFLSGAIVYLLARVGLMKCGDPANERLRKGWVIPIIGLCVGAATVHYWNTTLVYFCFLIGAGVWFLEPRADRTQ